MEHLSELLSLQLRRIGEYCIVDDEMSPRIIMSDFDFKSLLELSLQPLQTYGRRDYMVVSSLLHAAYQISLYDESKDAKASIGRFASSVILAADIDIQGPAERELLNERIRKLNDTRYFDLALMATKGN